MYLPPNKPPEAGAWAPNPNDWAGLAPNNDPVGAAVVLGAPKAELAPRNQINNK